jgi:3-oxoacyl-(acyl-carrier-protein) synthase
VSYGCTSSAGPTSSDFFEGLQKGKDHTQAVSSLHWAIQPQFEPKACTWKNSASYSTSREALISESTAAWQEACLKLTRSEITRIQQSRSVGVILASTKSYVDDFIWNEESEHLSSDAFAPLIRDFVRQTGLRPSRTICISNACASSLSALFLAQHWLKENLAETVVLLAVDRVGPFVLHGFQGLRALTPELARPFANNRSGLRLGDAAAVLILKTSIKGDSSSSEHCFEISGVGLDAEGHAVTRPSQSGDSLQRACLQLPSLQKDPPQFIIAHGTGTPINDAVEDQVFFQLFKDSKNQPRITASKGSIGHTLGASGAMDIIAACEALRRQEIFSIVNTPEIDSSFKNSYLHQNHSYPMPDQFSKIMVTSLGFGGIHAAALVHLAEPSP